MKKTSSAKPKKHIAEQFPMPGVPAAKSTALVPVAPAPLVIDAALEIVPGQPVTIINPVPVEQVAPQNQYHRNGMAATAQAACWFVLTGLELMDRKKALKHGGWEKWVEENCEYSPRTARNYMVLAEGVKRRSSNRKHVSDLALLNTPPAALTPNEFKTLLKTVNELTDGNTIRELYLEYGIIKKPKLDDEGGGDEKAPPTPEEALRKLTEDTREWAGSLLESPAFQKKTWRSLGDDENRAIAIAFKEMAAEIERWLRVPVGKRAALALEDFS